MAPPTAYMFFCNSKREEVRQKLLAEGHVKIPVTVVAKELGQLWKALSDEEKASYKAQAEEQHQQQQAVDGEAQQGPDAGEQQQHEGASEIKAATLPAAWVRRVIGVDPEINRCSAEALLAMSAAADVFLAALCAQGDATAVSAKRRTVRLDEYERSVRGDKRLVTVGLTAVMNMVAAAVSAAEEGKTAPPGKKPRLDKPAGVQNNSIERAFGLA